jgi:L-lactate dehydrogenase (cytochrome)
MDRVDTSCTILGSKFSVPFIICPAGGGKLANPLGEVLLTKAAGKHQVLHWISNVAGCTKEELAEARSANQNLYWQVYPKTDLKLSEEEIKTAIALGYKGFALTVDAVRIGKREYDIRVTTAEDDLQGEEGADEEAEEEADAHESAPTAVVRQ